jgi:carotenoid cleavage dioxygenase
MINQSYAGLEYQYVYSAVPTKGQFTFDGLIKHDVVKNVEETYLFGEGIYGSETVVAPKPNAKSEDDAYLVTFVSDINQDISQCLIFDAQSVSGGPIARVQLPERISSGTHSCWASATQLP